jgi:hypothetical protein
VQSRKFIYFKLFCFNFKLDNWPSTNAFRRLMSSVDFSVLCTVSSVFIKDLLDADIFTKWINSLDRYYTVVRSLISHVNCGFNLGTIFLINFIYILYIFYDFILIVQYMCNFEFVCSLSDWSCALKPACQHTELNRTVLSMYSGTNTLS